MLKRERARALAILGRADESVVLARVAIPGSLTAATSPSSAPATRHSAKDSVTISEYDAADDAFRQSVDLLEDKCRWRKSGSVGAGLGQDAPPRRTRVASTRRARARVGDWIASQPVPRRSSVDDATRGSTRRPVLPCRFSARLASDATRTFRDGVLTANVDGELVRAHQSPDGTVWLPPEPAAAERLRWQLALDDDHSDFLRSVKGDPVLSPEPRWSCAGCGPCASAPSRSRCSALCAGS